jgi:hypothetical protein
MRSGGTIVNRPPGRYRGTRGRARPRTSWVIGVADDYDVFDGLVRFRRFRLNVIEFLKLPHDISEEALRNVLKRSNASLLRTYEDRAERARPRLRQTAGSGAGRPA